MDQLDANDPDHMEAWAAWHEAEKAFEDALAALADLINLQGATVTQTFKIPDALVGVKNVKYVAVHDTNPYAAELAAAEQAATYNREFDRQAWDHYAEVKALYDGWEEKHGSGAEFGTVRLSDYGKTLIATYRVKGFSPFIVYAFVEADERSYKELSATIVDKNQADNYLIWAVAAAAGLAAGLLLYSKKKRAAK